MINVDPKLCFVPKTEIHMRDASSGEEDKEDNVGSYWMTLRKGEDTLI
jgi:hypothetical protein